MTSSRFILNFSCPDQPGIVNSVTGILASINANIEESAQFSAPDSDHTSNRFFMRVEISSSSSKEKLESLLMPISEKFCTSEGDFKWNLFSFEEKTNTIIMVSKEGHCLNDLLYRERAEQLHTNTVAVVSNHEDLEPLAQFYNIPFYHIPLTSQTKKEAETKLKDIIHARNVELTILARYMQILSDDLCSFLEGRAINIHHSFLPSFKGAKPYNQAYDRGVKLTGATAHYVTADLDEGPIIEQEVTRVDHTHTPTKLVALGRDVEARALSEAVRLHAEHRVIIHEKKTIIFR